MKMFFVMLILLVAPTLALAKTPSPPEPYVDKGVCPGEGCTYGKWTVVTETVFYKDMDGNSPILFSAGKGEIVTGLTGSVITTQLGKSKATKPIVLGEKKKISLKAGDTVYILSYVGEGYYKLWFNGQIDTDQIGMMTGDESVLNKDDKQVDTFGLQGLKVEKTEWWVKVKNSKGQIGWTIADGNFDQTNLHE